MPNRTSCIRNRLLKICSMLPNNAFNQEYAWQHVCCDREREEREKERGREREGKRERERERERESMYIKLHVCTIDGSSKYNLLGHTHRQAGRQAGREGGCTHITQQLDLAHFTLYELRAQVPLSSHGCKEERRDVRQTMTT